MDRLKPVVEERRIKKRIVELGEEISRIYRDISTPLICLCVLKGAVLFFSDLIREMDLDVEVDFVRLSSYRDGTSPDEKVLFTKDMELSVKNRHVLIIEDIVDTGATIAYLKKST